MEFNDQQNSSNDEENHFPKHEESTPSQPEPEIQQLEHVLSLVSAEDFRRLGVVPMAYDQSNSRLKLLFSETVDEQHCQELFDRLPNITIEWHKVEDNILSEKYQQITCQLSDQEASSGTDEAENPIALCDAQFHETPQPEDSEQPEQNDTDTASEPTNKSTEQLDKKTVLFITPSGNISHHLNFAFNAEKSNVITVKNLDEATAELKRLQVECVFIHESIQGQLDQFIEYIQSIRPETPIRFYHSEASLLMNDTRNQTTFDLVKRNLSLFSRLNDNQGSAIADHTAAVVKFAERMAIRLMVPDHCRLMIMTAAFLHNMAEKTLNSTDGLQQTDIINLSASKLESWDFPALVTQMLRQMHSQLDEEESIPDDVVDTGSSILTAADMFCHLWPDFSNANVHMDVVKRKLENHLQQKVTPAIITTLMDVVKDDNTAQLLRPKTFSVHIYDSQGSQSIELTKALQAADFVVTSSSNIGECVRGCFHSAADLLIIRDSGSVQDVYDTLMSLALHGLALDQLHTILLLDAEVVTDALRLLSHGVEEVLPASARNQVVVTKLTRIKNRLMEQYRHRVSAIEHLGTHGSLADMSLIAILESFRGNRQPASISVSAFGNQLTVYLMQGKVVAAECGDSTGLNALLKGFSWKQGIWCIESIDESELPEPDINENIDAVLIAACTKLDQVVKDEEISLDRLSF